MFGLSLYLTACRVVRSKLPEGLQNSEARIQDISVHVGIRCEVRNIQEDTG
jgi:hypothetical protein